MIEDYSDEYLKKILSETKTIAIVGASPNNERDSYKVMKTLLENEYAVFPVNPNEAGNKILGQICYDNLQAINQNRGSCQNQHHSKKVTHKRTKFAI